MTLWSYYIRRVGELELRGYLLIEWYNKKFDVASPTDPHILIYAFWKYVHDLKLHN